MAFYCSIKIQNNVLDAPELRTIHLLSYSNLFDESTNAQKMRIALSSKAHSQLRPMFGRCGSSASIARAAGGAPTASHPASSSAGP